MSMLNLLKQETNVAYTENGALAFATTGSALVDFFGQAGALRNRRNRDIIAKFTRAFAEDNLAAMKLLFYFRDIRQGQGERRTFRVIVEYMANNHTEAMRKNLHLIPFFGRWDDMYAFVGTKLEKEAFELMKEQFQKDLNEQYPSLLGKWLKSENASSYKTKDLAIKTRKHFGLSPKEYRQALSSLREKIKVVERLMSANEWSEIEYGKLPSKASLVYKNAFMKHSPERYQAYMDSLVKGEAKINAGAVFPYEIVRNVRDYAQREDDILNEQWKALPNFVGENYENSIAVVDVSGSMDGLPLDIAVSVGMYLAERNKGEFHNHFITFSSRPQLVEIQGSTFCERVRNIREADWHLNTNVKAVFDLILKTAIENKVPKEEMVKKLYIISDMEFDEADKKKNKKRLFQQIREEYADANYELPQLIFWNADARNDQYPVTIDENGVQLVSGASPSIFKYAMRSVEDILTEVLNDERYKVVTV